MSHWSEGYLTDIDYINYYCRNLNPTQLTVPFLMHNLAIPEIKTCCELGFGQGHSIVVHSQASTAEWYGTDFLPNQVLKARKLNEFGGKNHAQPHLYDESFAEFCQRDDLPEFDMIVFHGIWSWISDENRQIIVDFIRRKLKVGGVVYASYNMFPAWAQILPLKHMLETQYKLTPKSLSVEKRIHHSLKKVNEMVESSPVLKHNAPLLNMMLKKLDTQSPVYIAHEYLNEHLRPMYFNEIAQIFDQAKLTFACSSDYFEDIDSLILEDSQRAILQDIEDPVLRQTQKDIILMRQFRRDYWVKGAEKLSDADTIARWRNVRVILVNHPEKITYQHDGHRKIVFDETQFKAVINIISDYKIHSVGELIDKLADKYPQINVINTVAFLASKHDIEIAQSEEVIKAVKQRCQDFNHAVLDKVFEPNAPKFLISPIVATGATFADGDLMFVKALAEKVPQNKQVEWVWQFMQQRQQKFYDENKQELNDEQSLQLLQRAFETIKPHQASIKALMSL